MAMQPEFETSDNDSNADSISITSTVLSEQKDEYPLESILAEEKFQGVTKYLVKWEGYPEYRCTWETRSMFQDGEDSTFHEWETQKMRVSRGLSKPFDVPAFKNRVEIWLEGIQKRKLRRRAKRKRIGLPVSPIEIESDEYSSSREAEEEDEELTTVPRRFSLKRRAASISKASDGVPESEAIDTASSDESSSHLQWTSQEEGALMDGLRICKGPDWAQILSIQSQKLKRFGTSDLESRARRIKASFQESGKDIPQELRDVADKPSDSNQRIKNKVQQRKSVPRDQSDVDKRDRGSETDDSLFEELRIKNEAKLRKKRQRSDTDKEIVRAEQSGKRASSEGTYNGSATSKPQDAQMTKDDSKVRDNVPKKGINSESTKSRPQDAQKAKNSSEEETAKSSGRIPLPGALPQRKRRPSSADQGAPKAIMTTAQLKAPLAPLASRPGPVKTNAPLMGASKPGPERPPPKPKSQLGAVGRGPRRAPTSHMFIPKKKKRYATGADVLANWDSGKTHGNSALALKSLEVDEKSKKRYNKHSIARRAVKKGRTEPAPNIEDLQLINPKDGTAVKKVSVATPSSTTGKSAYELILERREQEKNKSIDDLFEAEPDDMAWMGAVEEERAVTSKVTPEPEAPTAKSMTDLPSERDIRTTADVRPKKKPLLSLQAYSQKLEARSAPNSLSAAPKIEPPRKTAVDNMSALTLTDGDSKSENSTTEVLPASSKSSGLPISAPPPGAPSAPKQFSSSELQTLPQGPAPRTTRPHLPVPNPLVMEPPTKEAAALVTKAIMPSERPSVVTVPSAPKAQMASGPAPKAGAVSATHTQIAPDIMQHLFTYEQNEVYGDVLVGPERMSKGTVRFRGFDYESRQRLIANKLGPKDNPFWLSSVCTAADYESRFHTDKSDPLFSSGQIVPYTTNLVDINDISETLRLNVSGAIYLGDHFTMVVFPIGSEDWAFLEQHMPAVPPVGLRCIIRSPIQLAATDSIHNAVGMIKERQSGQGITLEGEEPAINVVMRNLYGIDYPRLIRQPNQDKCQKGHIFYLIFPKERRDEQDLILHFLDANGALEVYSYNEDIGDGAWEYFYRSVFNNGIIIAHLTFWRFHRMPHFAKSIWYDNLVWGLGLRKSERLSHSHLIRLFPPGCMLLITDSLLLLQPLEAVKLLTWFRLRIMDEKLKKENWKIVMRPNIRRFLINCSRERKLDEEGRQFVQIYEQIAYMLDPEDLYDWEENEPKEEAPIYCMRKIKSFNTKVGRRVDYNKDLDHAAITRNDEVLADFFAGWANVHMQHYRRFLIISGFGDEDGKAQRDRWMEKWTYCEAFTPTHFARRHGVASQEDLDKDAVRKHGIIMAMLRSREADIDTNAKAEEADSREQTALIEKDWKAQLDRNPQLREMYEGLVKGSGLEELRLSGEEMAREVKDDDDEWSNDASSVSSVEMGEIFNEDEDMVDVGDVESSEVESWGLMSDGGMESGSSSSSSSGSDGE